MDKNTSNAIVLTGGKLFGQLRNSEYASMWEATPEGMLSFLHFLDKYVSKLVGRRELDTFFKFNRNKSLLDKITPSDIAYAILLCENGVNVWDESERIKATCATPEEKKKYVREANQMYHVKRGVRLALYGEGWTNEGKSYHGEIERGLMNLKNKPQLWEILETYWTDYAKENSRNCYERVVASSTGVVDGVGDDDSAQGVTGRSASAIIAVMSDLGEFLDPGDIPDITRIVRSAQSRIQDATWPKGHWFAVVALSVLLRS